MSDEQTVLADLTQGVRGDDGAANRARLRRAQDEARRFFDRSNDVYREAVGLADPETSTGAVARLVVRHEGSTRDTVLDPAFISAVREDLGTLPSEVEEFRDGEVVRPAYTYDPLESHDESFERTLTALNAAEDYVGLERTSAHALRLLTGIEESQHSEATRDGSATEHDWTAVRTPERFVRIPGISTPVSDEHAIVTFENVDAYYTWADERNWLRNPDDENSWQRPRYYIAEIGDRLGDSYGEDFYERLQARDAFEGEVKVVIVEKDDEQPTADRARALETLHEVVDASQIKSIEWSGQTSAPEGLIRPLPVTETTTGSDEALRDSRSLVVSVDGPDDAHPRFVGVDADGTTHALRDSQADRAAWMGLTVLAEHELEAELLSNAAIEATWAAPGDRVSASSAELEDDVWDRIAASPAPEMRAPLPGNRAEDRATDVRVDLRPLRGERATDVRADLRPLQERFDAAQSRASTSLDAMGVGHPSYGMNTRPDHPQPGTSPTQRHA